MAAAERAGARPQRIIFWPRRKPKTHMNIGAVTPAQMVHAVESWRSGAPVSSERGNSITPNLSDAASSRRARLIRHLCDSGCAADFKNSAMRKGWQAVLSKRRRLRMNLLTGSAYAPLTESCPVGLLPLRVMRSQVCRRMRTRPTTSIQVGQRHFSCGLTFDIRSRLRDQPPQPGRPEPQNTRPEDWR